MTAILAVFAIVYSMWVMAIFLVASAAYGWAAYRQQMNAREAVLRRGGLWTVPLVFGAVALVSFLLSGLSASVITFAMLTVANLCWDLIRSRAR